MSQPPTPPKPRPPHATPGGMPATPAHSIPLPRPAWPEVVLACGSCREVWAPDFEAFNTGNTGCRKCGGWTYIASTEPYTPTPRREA
jgi:hypothetical protein